MFLRLKLLKAETNKNILLFIIYSFICSSKSIKSKNFMVVYVQGVGSVPLTGVYIKFECHIFAPPPSWFIFLPQINFIIIRGWALQTQKLKPSLLKYCKFWVNWRKNMHTFYLWVKKYVFPPSSPFNHFFPQHVIWPYFWGVKQKNIHPCSD